VLTGGETSDYLAVPVLLDMLVAKPRALLADKGYDSDAVRERLLVHGILPVIPPKITRREPTSCDFHRYRDRNRIERMFNRLKQFRRIATRYDKTAKSYLGFLSIAAVKLWLPEFVNRT
jgi:transposase